MLGFLGVVYYYRRSLPKTNGKSPVQILQTLYAAATEINSRSTVSFEKRWKKENLKLAYDEAKQMLMNTCKLVHPDFNAPIAITTDASNYAIGGVQEQFSQGKWQPLGF